MSTGYRVAVLNSSLGTGSARLWIDVSAEVVAEKVAIKWMRVFKNRGYTTWVETADGQHYPVKGAKRAIKIDAPRETRHFAKQK